MTTKLEELKASFDAAYNYPHWYASVEAQYVASVIEAAYEAELKKQKEKTDE